MEVLKDLGKVDMLGRRVMNLTNGEKEQEGNSYLYLYSSSDNCLTAALLGEDAIAFWA